MAISTSGSVEVLEASTVSSSVTKSSSSNSSFLVGRSSMTDSRTSWQWESSWRLVDGRTRATTSSASSFCILPFST